MTRGILYISYTGMLEPLGQSQVLAYLECLADERSIHLISFERMENWVDLEERRAIKRRVSEAGIIWHPLKYHKGPSVFGTAWDIGCGIIKALYLARKHELAIVHARSYVPAVIALAIRKISSRKFLFDMRGFWPDERVDAGAWSRASRMYQVAKWFEKNFITQADHIVSLTQSAADKIKSLPYLNNEVPDISIIPTCTDLRRFSSNRSGREKHFVLGYVGSAGPLYLFDAVLESFMQLKLHRPNARLLIVNRSEHDYIQSRLVELCIPVDVVELRKVPHSEVPIQMSRMDAGIFFYRPSYSRLACSPTRLGEFLGCGIPCLANSGVGDTEEILEANRVGIAINTFDKESLRDGVRKLLALTEDGETRERCVAVAHRFYALDKGVAAYRNIYHSLEGSE